MQRTVAEAVKTIREARGFSLSELARRAGLAKATVSDLESNAGRSPGIDTLAKIADALDVHVATIIGIDTTKATAVEELDGRKAAQLIARHGLQFAPTGDTPTRFFAVGSSGFPVHSAKLQGGDVLIVAATGEPHQAGAVVVQNKGRDAGFEVRLFLDPYLIGPDCSGSLQYDMKQNPDLTIIGGIASRIGALS